MEKKLYRNSNKKMIAGVASGIADYFDIDVSIVRIIFVILFFGAGVSILAYIVLWIILPVREFENIGNINLSNQTNIEKKSNKGKALFGVILIFLGLIFLLDKFVPMFDSKIMFAILLITVGAFILIKSKDRNLKEESK